MSQLWPLSKSKILMHRQCPRWLWLETHRPDEKDDSETLQPGFSVGDQVGALARQTHANGALVDGARDFSSLCSLTREAMTQRVPVFEAAFEHKNVRVRTDLLLPLARSWHMAEVKSASEVKEHHIPDVAVQTAIIQKAGVRVSRASVRHIDKSFVYRGHGDYRGLLVDSDVNADVKCLVDDVPKWIRAARNTLNGDEPQIAMSNHCNEPWGCSYQGYCTRKSGRRAAFPVELLPNASGKRLAAELRDEGYSDLRRVPRHRMTTDLLNRVHAVTRTTEPYIDRVGARADIAGWKYPRAYLDFETVNFTVPIWAGTRPFQHIPFQFSCVIEKSDGSTARTDFLDLSGDNPARACAEKLLKALRGCQSVIAYSAKTERGVIQSLAARFPDLKHQLLALASRVVDLLPVVKTCYYHRDMLGSFSLKSVLPTIQPRLAYDLLDEVTEGTAAQRAYCEATERGTSAARRDDIRRKLLRYCGLDAVGMLEIVRHLTMT